MHSSGSSSIAVSWIARYATLHAYGGACVLIVEFRCPFWTGSLRVGGFETWSGKV